MKTCRNESCNMSHVDHEQRAYVMAMAQLFKINNARIGTCTRHDQTRAMLECRFADFVVIDKERVFLHAVGNEMYRRPEALTGLP